MKSVEYVVDLIQGKKERVAGPFFDNYNFLLLLISTSRLPVANTHDVCSASCASWIMTMTKVEQNEWM